MCRDDDSLPNESTIYRWLLSNEPFCKQYTRAREFQAEPHLEDILEIADDEELKPDDKRVRIDARKWAMSKLAAKKYGDKVALTGGDENDKPIEIIKRIVVDPKRGD